MNYNSTKIELDIKISDDEGDVTIVDRDVLLLLLILLLSLFVHEIHKTNR